VKNHRYILEPYKGMKTRYICPICNRSNKTFVRYIDSVTGNYINPSVGRCNREINCGYHYTPKQFFHDNNITIAYVSPKSPTNQKAISPSKKKRISFIPVEVFKKSLLIKKNVLQVAKTNHFIKYLIHLFGEEKASQLNTSYFIGTSKCWNGATVFWQIDISGKVRTGKIMLYNSISGKRVKKPFSHINWVHTASKLNDFELKQCLFGEHLLQDKTKPVAIVESEKTAVIASAYLPEFIWLAAGSLSNLTLEKCNVLKGRVVILFPDLKCYEEWSKKAIDLSKQIIGGKFFVSDLLERKANDKDKAKGFDLADYLVKFNYKDFIKATKPITVDRQPTPKPVVGVEQGMAPLATQDCFKTPQLLNVENWDKEIIELEQFFESARMPTEPIKVNKWSTITEINRYLESEFATLWANNGNLTFLPALNRLKELKQFLLLQQA